MPLISDRALCLRRHEFSETSQILSLLTEHHGLVRVIARGAHRTTKAGASKFDGGIDLLDEGDALFTDRVDKDLNTLAEWKLVDGHRDVRRSQRSLYLALYLAELVSNLFETQDPHPQVFSRFRETLDELTSPALEEAALGMALDAIADAGLEPYLSACVGCGASLTFDRALAFSPERGGVLCRWCAAGVGDRLPIDPRLVAIASALQRLPRDADGRHARPRLTRRQTDPLHAILARHVEHSTSRPLRMLRWIADPRRGQPAPPARQPIADVPAALPAPSPLPALTGEARGEPVTGSVEQEVAVAAS